VAIVTVWKYLKKVPEILYIIILSVFLFGLTVIPANIQVTATPDVNTWSSLDIPEDGEAGGWVMADGSDIRHLIITDDGTLYCYANPSGTDRTLFKSTDNGNNWEYTGGVTDTILDIAAVPGSSSTVYYATASGIFRSVDAGVSFDSLPPNPGGVGSNNVSIVCIDVVRAGENNIIAVGTGDSDNLQYGGVYILDESGANPAWADTGIGSYDVCALSFSPEYATDGQLIAVATDEQNTIIATKTGDSDWNQVIGEATIQGLAAVSADIAFTGDYDAATGDYILFVGVNTGNETGDVYKIGAEPAPADSTVTDLDIGAGYGLSGVDVSGLAASGTAAAVCLLAGCTGSTQVYRSSDSGIIWERSAKQPTGGSDTFVVVDNYFSGNGIAYTATTGAESAFSRTTDGGVTWNQSGLIDTAMTASRIIDLAVSPNYSQDNTLFMLTFNTISIEYSLWRSGDGGVAWERVFCTAFDNVDSLSMVELSPDYFTGNQVIYLAGTGDGLPALWKSEDNGQSYTYRVAPYQIDVFTVLDDDTIFFGGFDGNNGLVYKTGDGGVSYTTEVAAGAQLPEDVAASPDYEHNGIVMVGNVAGWVYYSSDNGNTFEPLPSDDVSPPFNGSVTIAFDPDFTSNNIVYAASSAADEGIYRFVLNQSSEWERIDDSIPNGGTISQLAVSPEGFLYAVNTQTVNTAGQQGGIERSLNPASQLTPTFETIVSELGDGVILSGLWFRGNRLWSIDTENNRLLTYLDGLTVPVSLVSPANEATGTGTSNMVLDWETLNGATEYRWQLDYSADFTGVPADFEGDTGASSVRLPELSTGTTYYWRVRAIEPVLGPWSDTWSFITALGQADAAPVLLSPEAGEEGVSPNPLFQWSAIAGAEEYELVVSTDISFDSLVIDRTGEYALPVTAWESDISLEYDSIYYWKVRAVGQGSCSSWSSVGVFVTESLPDVNQPVEVPLLLSPGAGARDVSLNPLFQWSAVDGAEEYELTVSGDVYFNDLVIDRTGGYALPVTAWESDISLEYDTTYYWRVRAVVDGDYSAWSAVGAFSTESMEVIDQTIGIPLLLSPAAGDEEISLNPLFQWDAVDGAEEYELVVSKEVTFESLVIDRTGRYALPVTAWQSNIGLNYNSTYYWRVRAVVDGDYSAWSAVSVFSTNSLLDVNEPVEAPVLLSPAAGAGDVLLNPLFQWSAIARAVKYELTVSRDASFNNPVIERTGRYALPVTAWQSNIGLDYNSTYYWKVRAAGPANYNSWSSVGVFITESPSETDQPAVVPVLLSPGAGAEKVTCKPLFQWDAVNGTTGYELEVSGDTYFDNNVIVKAGKYALTSTAWQSSIDLDYNCIYYWRVRAVLESGYSTWSAVGAFSTESIPGSSNPETEMTSREVTSPSPQISEPASEVPVLSSTLPVQQTIPDWVLYIGIGLLVNMVLLQITVILLVIINRPGTR